MIVGTYLSPIGMMYIASDGISLKGVWFGTQRSEFPVDTVYGTDNIISHAADWLDVYFSGGDPGDIGVPVCPDGSEFSRSVWALLETIPYGGLTTYGDIARRLESITGRKVSAQAVGGAVRRNPVSIIIPCHRVIGSDRGLVGYAGGLDIKIELLRLEGHTVHEGSLSSMYVTSM